jgi:hypothetical protein
MDRFREIPMPYASQVRARPSVAVGAAVALLALALACAALPTRAADTPPKTATDAMVKIKAFPPSIQVAAETTAAEKGDAAAQTNGGKRGESKQQAIHQAIERTISSNLRFDTDDDFDAFSNHLQKSPWVIGLIFLVVGSIFLTPIILLVGIIWYKLRKTRLQNEAMLALAEKGVVSPAQAADALASGAPAASVAPQVYQQAVALRKRVVWSDLRKGVILSMIGLGFLFYRITESGEPSWVGLILLFVGVGYVALWWLEERHLEQTGATRAGNGAGTSSSGG